MLKNMIQFRDSSIEQSSRLEQKYGRTFFSFIKFIFVFVIGVCTVWRLKSNYAADKTFSYVRRMDNKIGTPLTDYVTEVKGKYIADAVNGAEDEYHYKEEEEIRKVKEELLGEIKAIVYETIDNSTTDGTLESVALEAIDRLKEKKFKKVLSLANKLINNGEAAIEKVLQEDVNSSSTKILNDINNKEAQVENIMRASVEGELDFILLNLSYDAKEVVAEVVKDLLEIDTSCSHYYNKGSPVIRAKAPHLSLDNSLYKFLHPGKSGGGTFDLRVRRLWNIGIHQCHPEPCFVSSGDMTVFITIRDPIDRFVSAFNWRIVILCEQGTAAFDDPDHICFKNDCVHCRENEILFNTYNRNVSKLAEALCSNNEEVKRQAEEDLVFIKHAKYSLVDWLQNEKNWEQLVPVVLEKPFDLNKQIDEAVQYAQQQTHFEDLFTFHQRNEMVCRKDKQETNDDKIKETEHFMEHSSSEQHFPPLSNLGKKCLAQYYAKDYSLIQTLKEKSCKTEDCRQALQSILNRFNYLLNRNELNQNV